LRETEVDGHACGAGDGGVDEDDLADKGGRRELEQLRERRDRSEQRGNEGVEGEVENEEGEDRYGIDGRSSIGHRWRGWLFRGGQAVSSGSKVFTTPGTARNPLLVQPIILCLQGSDSDVSA